MKHLRASSPLALAFAFACTIGCGSSGTVDATNGDSAPPTDGAAGDTTLGDSGANETSEPGDSAIPTEDSAIDSGVATDSAIDSDIAADSGLATDSDIAADSGLATDSASDSGIATDSGVATDSATDSGTATDSATDAPNDAASDASSDAGACAPGVTDFALPTRGNPATAKLLWNGSKYGMFWAENPSTGTPPLLFNVFSDFVGAGGALLGTQTQVSPTDSIGHLFRDAAYDGTGYGVVWVDNVNGPPYYQAKFARVGADGAFVGGSIVSLEASPNMETTAAIAWNPLDGEYGVAFVETPSGTNTTTVLSFERIKNGAIVAGSVVTVDAAPGLGVAETPTARLIWTGSQYAITWQHAGVWVAEINRGAITLASKTAVGTGVVNPLESALAFNGSEYGVTWADYRTGTYEVHFARVKAGGGYVAGSDVLLGSAGGYSSDADIVWDGTQLVTAWTEGGGSPSSIWVAKIDPSGTIASKSAVTCAPDENWFPTISWNGTQHAVAYTHGTASTQQARVLFFP